MTWPSGTGNDFWVLLEQEVIVVIIAVGLWNQLGDRSRQHIARPSDLIMCLRKLPWIWHTSIRNCLDL